MPKSWAIHLQFRPVTSSPVQIEARASGFFGSKCGSNFDQVLEPPRGNDHCLCLELRPGNPELLRVGKVL